MWGKLLGAFCERGGENLTRCLELWAYPDTSLNLVVNCAGGEGEREFAFPCAPHQLVGVLENQTFRSQTDEGAVVIRRDRDSVTAAFTPASGDAGWKHSVPIEPFATALIQVAPEASRFVA